MKKAWLVSSVGLVISSAVWANTMSGYDYSVNDYHGSDQVPVVESRNVIEADDNSLPRSNTRLRQRSSQAKVQRAPQQAPVQYQQTQPQQQYVTANPHARDYRNAAMPNLSIEERLARLEQIIANLDNRRMSAQVDTIQQQMQDMHGRLDVAAHELQMIKAQQRDLYQDLDNRLNKVAQADGEANKSSAQAKSSKLPIAKLESVHVQENLVKEQSAYEQAYNTINKRQYSQAIQKMQQYLTQYPQGRFVANAHYWLGELYLLSGDTAQARQNLETVINQFAQHDKAPDALLKLGFLAYDLNDWKQAEQHLSQVVSRYPNSSSAQLAQKRLNEMQR
jgi:tol-pal system protein YbgF